MSEIDPNNGKQLPAALRHFDDRVAKISWKSWAALGGFGATIAVAIAWSVLGDIPTRVQGNCIIMSPDGLTDITADAPGRISSILVRPGQAVSVGQELARLSVPDVGEKVQAARLHLAELETSQQLQKEEARAQRKLSSESLAEQGKALRQREQSDLARIAIAEQHIDTNARLRSEGLTTARSAAVAKLDLQDAQTALADTRRRLALLDKQANELDRKMLAAEQKLDLQIEAARLELSGLESQSDSGSRLRSQVAGRVIEVKAQVGSLVKRDTAVFSVERQGTSGAPLEAVMYVSATDGKKIASGDQVHITLAHAAREEYGALLAKVNSASAYPATPQGLQNTIANSDLVGELARGAAPYELRIGLLPANPAQAGARNPYRWTSQAGSTLPLSGGALCTGDILVRHERPLSLVLPIIRSTVSGSTL